MPELKPCVPKEEWRFKKFTGCATPARFAYSLTWLIVMTVATWFVVFKPMFAYLAYKANQTVAVVEVYDTAKVAGSDGRIKLEQMTHQDSGLANIILQALYRADAIKSSGIDLKLSNADTSTVDTKKADELVLQAMREYSDYELLFVLRAASDVWDEGSKPLGLGEGDDELNYSQSIKNKSKIDHSSTLTKEQKDEISACHKKLDETFSNPVLLLINLRTVGSCSPYAGKEPTFLGTYSSMFKISEDTDKADEKN